MDKTQLPLHLTWLGQGGFLFQFEKTLCVDPYLSNAVARAEGFERLLPAPFPPRDLVVDLLLCTHDHLDHLDEETVRETDWGRLRYGGPESCLQHFRSLGIPPDRLVSLNRGERRELGDAVLYGVYAAHTADSIGVVLEYAGVRVYLVGDSEADPRLLEVRELAPDVLICCINGKLGNMNYQEAAELAVALGVRTAIPCHYGMFAENTEDPRRFAAALAGTGVRYQELTPFQAYPLAELVF